MQLVEAKLRPFFLPRHRQLHPARRIGARRSRTFLRIAGTMIGSPASTGPASGASSTTASRSRKARVPHAAHRHRRIRIDGHSQSGARRGTNLPRGRGKTDEQFELLGRVHTEASVRNQSE